MNLPKLQQAGAILSRLLKEAERMERDAMLVRVVELKLIQEVTNALWAELNAARDKADKAHRRLQRVLEAIAKDDP